MTTEERMLQRFTRERANEVNRAAREQEQIHAQTQHLSKKRKQDMFNLDDDNSDADDFADSNGRLDGTSLTLTHGGRSITDDYEDKFFKGRDGDESDGSLDDADAERRDRRLGRIDARTVANSHFGGFPGEPEDVRLHLFASNALAHSQFSPIVKRPKPRSCRRSLQSLKPIVYDTSSSLWSIRS